MIAKHKIFYWQDYDCKAECMMPAVENFITELGSKVISITQTENQITVWYWFDSRSNLTVDEYRKRRIKEFLFP